MKSVHRNLSLPPINNINNNSSKLFSAKRYRGSTINTTSNNQKRTNSIKKIRIQTSKTINSNNDETTKSFIDDMKKGSYNILVCVRCRPLSVSEKQLSSNEIIRIMDNKMVILIDPIEYNGPKKYLKIEIENKLMHLILLLIKIVLNILFLKIVQNF